MQQQVCASRLDISQCTSSFSKTVQKCTISVIRLFSNRMQDVGLPYTLSTEVDWLASIAKYRQNIRICKRDTQKLAIL